MLPWIVLAALACAAFGARLSSVQAGEKNQAPPEAGLPQAASEPTLDDLRIPYTNPYYSTLAGYLGVKDVELKSDREYKLKIEGFRKKVPVRATLRRGVAPLVVVLLGLDGRADGDLGKLWPSWLENAGCHVLFFDSTFTPQFIDISGHGVTGNVFAEADRIVKIIDAFQRQELNGRVSQTFVVGMSYGGLQALAIGQRAAAGKVSFEIAGIQAYSPPIKLRTTGELLDRWYDEDRTQYKLTELASKLQGHKPVSGNSRIPFDDTLMRAGISAVFRLGLADVIVRNDDVYKVGVLPRTDTQDESYIRKDYAGRWGYTQFMDLLVWPYWQDKWKLNDIGELTGPLELRHLMANQNPNTEVILSGDDPFNLHSDLVELQSTGGLAKLTVLPRGGHLGFAGDPYTRRKLYALVGGPELSRP